MDENNSTSICPERISFSKISLPFLSLSPVHWQMVDASMWHENGWCTNEPGCDDYEELDDFDSENFEVIGNMIDNPELLEV